VGVTTEKLHEHSQKYRVTYMINFFASILPVMAVVGIVWTQFDKLVLTDELNTALANHRTSETHTASEQEIEQINGKVDTILLLNMQDRIEKMLRAVCTNPNMRDALDPTVRSLIQEYNKISGIPYVRPTCNQLGALR